MRTQDPLLLVVVIFLIAFNCDAQPTESASVISTEPEDGNSAVVSSGSNVYVGHAGTGTANFPGNVYAYNCNFAPVPVTCTLFTTLPHGNEAVSLSGVEFGWSIAVSGSLLVVGAPHYGGNNLNGAVVLYNCSTSACTFITYIIGPSISNFGYKVGVYGSTVAVSVSAKVQVYLYQCSSTCLFGSAVNEIGFDLALSGAVLAIASRENGGFIYQCANYSSCTTTPIVSVSGSHVQSVSVFNGLVVFGDTGPSEAYVISCTTSVPVSCGNITTLSNPAANGGFGASVSIYGNTVVVSHPTVTVDEVTFVGEVFVYTCTPNNGPGSTVTCVGPSEGIIPTSPIANQEIGDYYQSLDETSGGALVGDDLGHIYAVSLQNFNNPTTPTTPTPTPTATSTATATPTATSTSTSTVTPTSTPTSTPTQTSTSTSTSTSTPTSTPTATATATITPPTPTPTSTPSAEPIVNASLVATVASQSAILAVVNSGSNVFVGVPNIGSGNVYAYNCNFVSLACTLLTTLPNGNENLTYSLSDSYFGASIAVSGTTLVVGVPAYSGNTGVVLLYDCSTTNCNFITSITGFSSDSLGGDSVAVDGSTVAVSVGDQVNLYQCSSVCLFGSVINVVAYDLTLSGVILAIASYSDGNIYQCANYTDCTTTPISSVSGGYVASVSVSNGLVVFGDEGASDYLGAVYVVSCTTSAQVSCGDIFTIPNPSAYKYFGTSVSVYGNTVVVSDPKIQVNGLSDVGAVFVYTCTPNNGSGSTVTCVGPSEEIIPTSPQANQYLGYYYQSLDEASSGVVLVGDEVGNLYYVSLQNSNNPTPTTSIPTLTATSTATATPTATSTATSTKTSTVTPTSTSTATLSSTPTSTATATATSTLTATPTSTSTSSSTPTATATTSATSSSTPISTTTQTSTPTPTVTSTATATSTATNTATSTSTSTPTSTPTSTSTLTSTPTVQLPTVFTGSLVSLSGSNVAVNPSETRSCRIVEGSDLDLYAGYPVTINGTSVCCRYVGLLSGSNCDIQSCGITKISSINYATNDNVTCYADSVCYSQGSYDATAEAIPVYNGTALSGTHSISTAGPSSTTVFIQKTNGVVSIVSAAFKITPSTKRRTNLAAEYGCSLKGTYTTGPPASCSVSICGSPATINDYFYDIAGNCYVNCIGST